MRAARRLWARVLELSGVPADRRGLRLHAVTSRPMLSSYDPWVNMLRTCVAAFSAGVGGADAVTVLPFDAPVGLPDAFARRIARNTSSLLIDESHVARVDDPAAGAYAVERLTDDLARAGWAELDRIEAAGGVAAALADGSLRGRVADVVAERDRQVATRRMPLTGLTEFPDLAQAPLERTPYPEGALPVRPYGHAFEALRDAAPEQQVYLATMGTIAAHTARATFASNLLAAGGIGVVNPGRARRRRGGAGALPRRAGGLPGRLRRRVRRVGHRAGRRAARGGRAAGSSSPASRSRASTTTARWGSTRSTS